MLSTNRPTELHQPSPTSVTDPLATFDPDAMDILANTPPAVTTSSDSSSSSLTFPDPPSGTAQSQPLPPNTLLDARIAELLARQPNDFQEELPSRGDTWVFVDAPLQQSDQSDAVYEEIKRHFAQPMRVESHKLRSLNSPILNQKLGPTEFFRTTRRRHMVGKTPSNIRYVVDLTPASEGDDAILATMDLSCSWLVRLWGLSMHRWSVGATMVGGKDEFDEGSWYIPLHDKVPVEGNWNAPEYCTTDHGVDVFRRLPGMRGPFMRASLSDDKYWVPAEYTPLRHRMALQCLLRIIEGYEPNLDSATKVYSLFVVSKNFQFEKNPATDYIIRWLRAPPNNYFLEVLPEVSLKIADGLQNEPLCRDSFAILIGESALETVCADLRAQKSCVPQPQSSCPYTVHGRRKEDVPESYLTRIEYARTSLIERVNRIFWSLVDPAMSWIEGLPTFRALVEGVRSKDQTTQQHVVELAILLKKFVRGMILRCLHTVYRAQMQELGKPGFEVILPRSSFNTTLSGLDERARIFTRSFWLTLKDLMLTGPDALPVDNYSCTGLLTTQKNKHTFNDPQGRSQKIPHITTHMLLNQIRAARRESQDQSLAYGYENAKPESAFTLPFRFAADLANTSSDVEAQDFGRTGSLYATPTVQMTSGEADIDWWNCPDSYRSAEVGVVHDTKEQTLGQAQNGSAAQLETSESRSREREQAKDEREQIRLDRRFFNLAQFFREVREHLVDIASRMLASPGHGQRGDTLDLNLSDTLICLDEDEFKYLPLWAGGYDDGTNGVYSSDVPFAVGGFSTPGPHIHTGTGSSKASSEFEMIDASTEGDRSTVVHDGYSSIPDHRSISSFAAADNDEVFRSIMHQKNGYMARRSEADADDTTDSGTWQNINTPSASGDTVSVIAPNGGIDSESSSGSVFKHFDRFDLGEQDMDTPSRSATPKLPDNDVDAYDDGVDAYDDVFMEDEETEFADFIDDESDHEEGDKILLDEGVEVVDLPTATAASRAPVDKGKGRAIVREEEIRAGVTQIPVTEHDLRPCGPDTVIQYKGGPDDFDSRP